MTRIPCPECNGTGKITTASPYHPDDPRGFSGFTEVDCDNCEDGEIEAVCNGCDRPLDDEGGCDACTIPVEFIERPDGSARWAA